MPDPNNSADQLRFAQIRSRMFNNLVKNLPPSFMEHVGVKSKIKLKDKLYESNFLIAVIDSCAYVAMEIEKEKIRDQLL